MKLSAIALPVIAALALSACNLSKVTKEGTTENPVWPDPAKTTFRHNGTQHGSWPNWDNVRQIEAGMNKDQIYNLIGRPHHQEGLYGVREWDYLFNYRENGEHKTCQYKILFDKDKNAQSFFWNPEGCAPKEKEPVREVIIREVAPAPAVRIRQ
ncbi:outer membrane protein assembly factor BamE [Neisseria sp. CCUG12390]|uniref:outer membrane protein assembly factor BamE n=1 Tax=Neisseria sp. CCUG12390 TaxID=3392035 RepID=UPI003A1007E9